MITAGSLTVFVLLGYLIAQGEGDEKIYDRYFNGFCYWSEEVSYHVHYSSECKVYFTCQRGKFLDFHRCPDSTVFNYETLRCEPNGICKEKTSLSPAYLAWWKKVVGKIDDVLEELKNSSARNLQETSTSSPVQTQNKLYTTILPQSTTPPQVRLRTKSVGSTEATPEDKPVLVDAGNISNLSGSISSHNVTESTVKISSGSNVSTLNTSSSKTVHIIPMQFDTQTTLRTEKSFPPVTTQSLQEILQEEISKAVEESNFPHISAITMSPNTTKKPNFMNDLVLPLYQEVVKNATIMSDVSTMFNFLFLFADPLIYRIFDQQVDEKQGAEIKISLREIKNAVNELKIMARPFLMKILREVFPLLFSRLSEKSGLLVDLLDSDGDSSSLMDKMPSMFGNLIDLVLKYRLMDKVSASDQFKIFALSEIRKDFKIVFDIVSNIL